jgi:hypothetical protein
VSTDLPAVAPRRRRGGRRIVVDLVAVLGGAALLGVVGGVVWQWWWTPPQGAVQDGTWLYLDFPTIERVFSGTALYVVIGLLGGILLGVVAAWFSRAPELLVLVAVAAGGALAGYLALQVGTSLGPDNPYLRAVVVDDGTTLPGHLAVTGRSPYVAWPLGALLGLAVTYLMRVTVVAGVEATRPFDDGPRPATHVG